MRTRPRLIYGVGREPDLAGLLGFSPETVDPDAVLSRWAHLADGGQEHILGARFHAEDIVLAARERPFGHPNSMTFEAWRGERRVAARSFLSVGGGFIEEVGSMPAATRGMESGYRSMTELLGLCAGGTIAEIAWADEVSAHGTEAVVRGIDAIWTAMCACIEEGLLLGGVLPGPLRVRRRAAEGWAMLPPEPSEERLALYAMAVNE